MARIEQQQSADGEPIFAGNYYRNYQEAEAWQSVHSEDIVEPELPIVDPHHHLVDNSHGLYLLPEFAKDLNSGHKILSTVYVQARAMFRKAGPEHLTPVGETEFARGIAAMSASGQYGPTQVCAGIVGFADMRDGRVEETLHAHIEAGGGRFRGIRQPSPWVSGRLAENMPLVAPKEQLRDPNFRRGFAHLAPLKLRFDVWLFHTQLDDAVDLARRFPETSIIVDHLGGRLAVGPYSLKVDDVNAAWRKSLTELATCPNITMKVGGLGMLYGGPTFHLKDRPPSSEELAPAWAPFVKTAIDLFGVDRCMMESNFPQDKQSQSYQVLWNTLKRVSAGYTKEEKKKLFQTNAERIYDV